MKKVLALCLIWVLALSLSGCGIFDMLTDDKDVVDLGGGDTYVRWNLVWTNNEYRPVQSAYFEFNEDNFKYYENGVLKKEGTHRITYSGVENTISPLHIDLNFGNDKNGFAVYDYLRTARTICINSQSSPRAITLSLSGQRVECL